MEDFEEIDVELFSRQFYWMTSATGLLYLDRQFYGRHYHIMTKPDEDYFETRVDSYVDYHLVILINILEYSLEEEHFKTKNPNYFTDPETITIKPFETGVVYEFEYANEQVKDEYNRIIRDSYKIKRRIVIHKDEFDKALEYYMKDHELKKLQIKFLMEDSK